MQCALYGFEENKNMWSLVVRGTFDDGFDEMLNVCRTPCLFKVILKHNWSLVPNLLLTCLRSRQQFIFMYCLLETIEHQGDSQWKLHCKYLFVFW